MKTLFLLYCLFGNLQELIEIYNKNIDKKNDIDYQTAFLNCCSKGHLHIIKQLLIWFPYINISHDDDIAFRLSCGYGHIDIINYLYLIKPDINISACNEDGLKKAVWNGHLHIVKKLLYWNPNINLSIDNEYIFLITCNEGHLNILTWLLENKPNINIFINNNEGFINACKNNHSNIVKYLINFNYEIYNLEGLKYICQNGNLDLLKYIYNISTTRNIFFDTTLCFNIASDFNYFNIILFLIEIKPNIIQDKHIKLTTKIKINLINLGYNLYSSVDWINYTCKFDLSNCSICLDKNDEYILTPCNHIFCKKCITSWLLNNNTCPNCRKNI